jgi:hypothetical protein
MPDAPLLRLCREFHILRAADHALPIDEVEQFCTGLRARRAMCADILATRPTSAAGRKAAAGVAIQMLADGEHPFAPELASC